MKLKVLLIIFLSCCISCKKADESLDSKTQSIVLPAKIKVDPSKTDGSQSIEQKIIKEANLRFETSELESTYNQIVTNTKEAGGTIQNDSEGKDYGSIYKKLIIRVPNQNFDVFIKNISKGVAYFENKEITAQDVTAEYIDIDARIKAKKSLENRYIELLNKANKVSEMLEIEKELATIREEIEAKQGELNYLQSRISESTITIYFYKNVAADGGVTNSYGSKIWNAITSGFNSLSSFLIALLSIWPFLIILTTIIYFIRKKIKQKNKN
ncbi:DUF4349 domain-containing protein [Flavobacterium sp.]|uniref:DUF4349 domain-containing protein n=1 Tax=Flavobacterium sp. TaxID=239 RepID=UPI002618CBB6|nr:DUF4349 domain-containing protein [Flavobacterium sp.]MDG2431859.1 DUF4349 domain-containing protein [Flavobacterium sp.]